MSRFERLADLQAQVGQAIGSSDWTDVTQQHIDQFAQTTSDAQWIHVDPVRAAAGPFGTTIAHGFFTLSLLPHMATQAFDLGTRMTVNYGLERMRFPAPVPVGSRLRGHFKLLAFQPLDGGAQIVLDVTVEREGSAKPVCVAQWVLRCYA